MEKFVISSINVPFWLISNPQKVWMFDEVTPDCKGFEAYFYSYFIFFGLLVISLSRLKMFPPGVYWQSDSGMCYPRLLSSK